MEWIITNEESGQKLLFFLTQRLHGQYSARYLKKIIDHNGCQINGRIERFASTVLGKGDHVIFRLELAPQSFHQIEKSRILYEDEALFIYDKPAGITSDEQGILRLLKPYDPSLHLVHRLDRDTTGVLLLAKRPEIFEKLVAQFKEMTVLKKYRAIVDGILASTHGIIENHLGKKQSYAGQTMWGSVKSSHGLYACTEWSLLKRGSEASLVACFPKTGRTHQIRVHMAENGHPILGDFQYGKHFKCAYQPDRSLLHAEEISFLHPLTAQSLSIKAHLPDDFKKAQQKLFKE